MSPIHSTCPHVALPMCPSHVNLSPPLQGQQSASSAESSARCSRLPACPYPRQVLIPGKKSLSPGLYSFNEGKFPKAVGCGDGVLQVMN